MSIIEAKGELGGYAGKILRLDLTNSTTQIISTYKYVPRYLGGRAVCNKIFWDEVKGPVKAFDPENKLIFMTGPGCGTGLPVSGRCTFTGVAPNALPEQYSHSSIGGFFGGMLKWAGYDGLIIEGKAPEHTYVYIENDKVEFRNADCLWGKLIAETQEEIFRIHGQDALSLVIGPAGENLHRNAIITTGSDSCAAKAGFGAVMGSKNLKAIAVKGTGSIRPGNIEKLIALRKHNCNPPAQPNPIKTQATYGAWAKKFEVPGGYKQGFTACSHGCNARCQKVFYDIPDPLNPDGDTVASVNKCVESHAATYVHDAGWDAFSVLHGRKQETPGSYKWFCFSLNDRSDPQLSILKSGYMGDKYDLWKPDFRRGNLISWLCNQYGIDKWDVIGWYFNWLVKLQKEGLLDELGLEYKVDMDDYEFIKKFMYDMTYRVGSGDIFAEGMARAIRHFGKEKYGDAPFHGRYTFSGENLEIPLSNEAGWGMCTHWQGRGFQSCPKYEWLIYDILCMVDTRDAVSSSHYHDWVEDYLEYANDPAHSRKLAETAVRTARESEMKDSVVTCDWRTPNPLWPDMEAELFSAATGLDVSREDIMDVAETSRLLYRAILMRNYGRDRAMEVPEQYPMMTYPDPWGSVATWDEWNDFVDLFYEESGWDLQTGWPTRSTWEKYGLGDIADEMESLGKLPPEGRKTYERLPDPLPERAKSIHPAAGSAETGAH